MTNYTFNLVTGSLYAIYDGRPIRKDDYKVIGLSWYSEDTVDKYYVTTSRITADPPEAMLEAPELPIPVYARREVFKTFVKYKGLAPRVHNTPLRLSDVISIIEYFNGVVLGRDLSGFRLYGVLPIALNSNISIGADGLIKWDNVPEVQKTKGFLHQRRPLDRNNRPFTKGASVKYAVNGESKNGQVLTFYNDLVIVDDSAVGDGKGQHHVAPDQIGVLCSKNRQKTSHSLEVKHDELSDFLYSMKDFILQQARDGGITLLVDSGYSIDAVARKSSSYPKYQLYNPGGTSLGIYSYLGRYYLIDAIEADLALRNFTEW